jgi:hypothetical protein
VQLKLPADQTTDRMLLVCFWDKDQRPSRHCIKGLLEQVAQLQARGVTVVTVHGSPVDESALKQWAAAARVTLPVGRVPEKPGATLSAWGVRGLPWLILTDCRHVVCADGFSLTELDTKVTEAAAR